MQYISTRGEAPTLEFDDVLLAGLASDGGLYLPKSWPRFEAADIREMQGLEYPELAVRVMTPFLGGGSSLQRLPALSRRRSKGSCIQPWHH